MTWLNRVPKMHECILPAPHFAGAGSVWQCDDCGKKWQVNVYVGGGTSGRRYGDHHWSRMYDIGDLPTPPAGASGTPLPPVEQAGSLE